MHAIRLHPSQTESPRSQELKSKLAPGSRPEMQAAAVPLKALDVLKSGAKPATNIFSSQKINLELEQTSYLRFDKS